MWLQVGAFHRSFFLTRLGQHAEARGKKAAMASIMLS
jgi:hypothetical protein